MVDVMANKRNLSLTRTHHLGVTGGKNYSVILPVEFVRSLKWRERQKLNITLEGERLIIEDWKK